MSIKVFHNNAFFVFDSHYSISLIIKSVLLLSLLPHLGAYTEIKEMISLFTTSFNIIILKDNLFTFITCFVNLFNRYCSTAVNSFFYPVLFMFKLTTSYKLRFFFLYFTSWKAAISTFLLLSIFTASVFSPIFTTFLFFLQRSRHLLLRVQDSPGISINDVSFASLPFGLFRVFVMLNLLLVGPIFILVTLLPLVLGANDKEFALFNSLANRFYSRMFLLMSTSVISCGPSLCLEKQFCKTAGWTVIYLWAPKIRPKARVPFVKADSTTSWWGWLIRKKLYIPLTAHVLQHTPQLSVQSLNDDLINRYYKQFGYKPVFQTWRL